MLLTNCKKILVTGATGYVGGRLIPELLNQGYQVRAISRTLSKLQARSWAKHPNMELMQADALNAKEITAACQNMDAAYYLVHSMVAGQNDFAQADRVAAQNMIDAAQAASLKRLIYLGGLGDASLDLSHHLQSRSEVSQMLAQGSVPTTILRAAMIIGSGSASFEILRYLVERLPVMITPKWLQTPCQPIAIRNVIGYLTGCLTHPQTIGKTFDIGGSDILNYRELMEIYAQEAGLRKRLIIPVPVLTPRLSSYWIHLVTPVPAAIAQPLAEGLKNPVICQDQSIVQIIPQKLLSCREAICLGLEHFKNDQVVSHWTDAGRIPPFEGIYEGDPHWSGGTVFKDQRTTDVKASAEKLWQVISGIGGKTGWYHANWLWRIRGHLDRLVGGVGLRRGRRDSQDLMPGDALDFWRVADVQKNKTLLLVAEMKLPGTALLKFEILPVDANHCQLRQTALFQPKGIFGILYWYAVLPFHGYIFQGMMMKIKELAAAS